LNDSGRLAQACSDFAFVRAGLAFHCSEKPIKTEERGMDYVKNTLSKHIE
jgi:hypothetical protein